MMKTMFALVVTALLGCSGGNGVDEVVGASCVDNFDCDERCLRGGDYPGGFCSVSCRDDLDCPDDTICAAKDGGVCLFPCDVSSQCDFLGQSYVCRDADDWSGRRVGVCLGD